MPDVSCLFCRIAKRQLTADIIAEEKNLLAFRDIRPQAPTHILIIPTEHIPSIAHLTDQHTLLIGQIILLAKRLAKQFQVAETGYRLVINCGLQAGQSVDHLHLHLLGGRSMQWPPG